MLSHAASSRSVSRPGSTTAPFGSRAIASRNFAVAGIEPVDPAATTGPLACLASRAASAAISRSRRVAASMQPSPARCAGQASRAILRKSSESCQYRSSASGTRPSSAAQSTPRVAMSSISRARSVASASVAAGPPAISGASSGLSGRSCRAQAATSRDRVSRRVRSSSAGAISKLSRRSDSAKAPSSSSMSPSVTMRGRIAASRASTSRNTSRAMRPARRVGRYSVASASRPGSWRAEKPGTRSPSTSAMASVRRNGAEAGMLKTRMSNPIRRSGYIRMGSRCRCDYQDRRRGSADIHATLARNALSAAATASGVPTCIHSPSRRRPRRRPCSPARSNSCVSANSPCGLPAKIAGDRMATPA